MKTGDLGLSTQGISLSLKLVLFYFSYLDICNEPLTGFNRCSASLRVINVLKGLFLKRHLQQTNKQKVRSRYGYVLFYLYKFFFYSCHQCCDISFNKRRCMMINMYPVWMKGFIHIWRPSDICSITSTPKNISALESSLRRSIHHQECSCSWSFSFNIQINIRNYYNNTIIKKWWSGILQFCQTSVLTQHFLKSICSW